MSANLRKYDPEDPAYLSGECAVHMIGNGQCDWEIQGNPHGSCDYDRKDCKESLECLELPTILEQKVDESEWCAKVRFFCFFRFFSNFFEFFFAGQGMGLFISAVSF